MSGHKLALVDLLDIVQGINRLNIIRTLPPDTR